MAVPLLFRRKFDTLSSGQVCVVMHVPVGEFYRYIFLQFAGELFNSFRFGLIYINCSCKRGW